MRRPGMVDLPAAVTVCRTYLLQTHGSGPWRRCSALAVAVICRRCWCCCGRRLALSAQHAAACTAGRLHAIGEPGPCHARSAVQGCSHLTRSTCSSVCLTSTRSACGSSRATCVMKPAAACVTPVGGCTCRREAPAGAGTCVWRRHASCPGRLLDRAHHSCCACLLVHASVGHCWTSAAHPAKQRQAGDEDPSPAPHGTAPQANTQSVSDGMSATLMLDAMRASSRTRLAQEDGGR